MKRIHFDYLKQAPEIPRLWTLRLFKNRETKNPKKILIVNTALVGDILASFPAISQFIKHHKSARVDLMVTSPVKPLAEKIRGVNRVYSAKSISGRAIEKSGTLREIEELIKKDFDQVIVLRLSKEAYKLLKKMNYKSISTTFNRYLDYVGYISKKDTIEPVKQVRQFFFEALDEKDNKPRFEDIFDFAGKDYLKLKKIPEMRGKEKKILIHTGSGWELKHWANEKWIELLRDINKLGKFKFIFIGADNAEARDFELIQNQIQFKLYSLIRKVDLKQLMLVMKFSDYFIGIDSGPRNMTYLADLRSIGLVGPGPRIYMPYSKKDIIINKSNCKCTASFCLRRETCMQKITVEEVFSAFKKLAEIQ